jgi:hypothetical protein
MVVVQVVVLVVVLVVRLDLDTLALQISAGFRTAPLPLRLLYAHGEGWQAALQLSRRPRAVVDSRAVRDSCGG